PANGFRTTAASRYASGRPSFVLGQCLQELFAAAAGDGQAGIAYQHHVTLHAAHILQVDQTAGTAASKIRPLQQLLKMRQGPPLLQYAVVRMHKDVVRLYLDVKDVACRHAPQQALTSLEVQCRAVTTCRQCPQRAL